ASSGELKYRDMVKPAIDSIAALGTEAVPLLVDKFTTKSARERHTIINILKEIGSAAVPSLVAALNRPSGLVVQRVCWALGDIGDTAAVTPLIEQRTHSRWQVREQVMDALGDIADKRGSAVAQQALRDSIGQVRKAAAVACGKIGVDESIEELVHALSDAFYGARMSAVNSLLSLDTAVVLAALSDSLPSSSAGMGNLACYVLGQIGSDEAIELLRVQTSSPDPERRAHASVALVAADPLDNCGYRESILAAESDRLVRLKIESAVHQAAQQDM
ncbi:MAG: HEAT repeat domain-containing protein, partial [Candidatus Zixiibacteriota bacterium]